MLRKGFFWGLRRVLAGPVLFLPLLLIGCVTNGPPQAFLTHYQLASPRIDDFQVCARFGCDDVVGISYQQTDWQHINALFEPPSLGPKQERERIANAVALMESLTGQQVNTANDQARNDGWLAGSPQLDCVAESANTTVSLLLLQQLGVLKYHRILYPSHRGLMSLQSPHNAATIEELGSSKSYVVDSWFYANGEAPVIVSTESWKAGFDPDHD
ncbi:MAG: hypothetical protein V7739_18995 [Motiliproteus sp.]